MKMQPFRLLLHSPSEVQSQIPVSDKKQLFFQYHLSESRYAESLLYMFSDPS